LLVISLPGVATRSRGSVRIPFLGRILRKRKAARSSLIACREAKPKGDEQGIPLTSDGRILGWDEPSGGRLLLWSPTGTTQVPAVGAAQLAIINDTGDWVVYEAGKDADRTLRSIHVRTGRDVVLARGATAPFQPSISNDGWLVLFVDNARSYVINPDGTGQRLLAHIDDDVTTAVIAGFGRVAFVVTRLGRLLKVTVETGSVEELIAPTPVCYLGAAALVPGSMLPIRGTGLSSQTAVATEPLPATLGGVRVLVNDQALPVYSVSPEEIWFQVPFEFTAADMILNVRLNDRSIFEGGPGQVEFASHAPSFFSNDESIAVHEDFSSLITRQIRARAGEIVHLYAIGLGAVEPTVPTGARTPAAPVSRVRDRFECTTGPTNRLEVRFAGLAPGMIGIYQVDVRVPNDPPKDTMFVTCRFPDDRPNAGGGFIYTLQ
jgi:uncharacterized protein (TIGR03437 family)